MAAREPASRREGPVPGLVLVVSAPSGVGKTTLCRAVLDRVDGLAHSVSVTTRPPRAGEVEGRDYMFVSDTQFDALVAEGDFAEWAVVHGRRYGTPRTFLEEHLAAGVDVVLALDVEGARNLSRRYAGQVVRVFVLPPSWEVLRRRLLARGTEDTAEVDRRLDGARREVAEAPHYDYIIMNDELPEAVETLASILLAERARATRVAPGLVRSGWGDVSALGAGATPRRDNGTDHR